MDVPRGNGEHKPEVACLHSGTDEEMGVLFKATVDITILQCHVWELATRHV